MTKAKPKAVAPEWTLGDRLAKARETAHLKQSDMAREFKVSRAAIGTWERDEVQPRDLLYVIQRWAELTRTPVSWLLGVVGDALRGGPIMLVTSPSEVTAPQVTVDLTRLEEKESWRPQELVAG